MVEGSCQPHDKHAAAASNTATPCVVAMVLQASSNSFAAPRYGVMARLIGSIPHTFAHLGAAAAGQRMWDGYV